MIDKKKSGSLLSSKMFDLQWSEDKISIEAAKLLLEAHPRVFWQKFGSKILGDRSYHGDWSQVLSLACESRLLSRLIIAKTRKDGSFWQKHAQSAISGIVNIPFLRDSELELRVKECASRMRKERCSASDYGGLCSKLALARGGVGALEIIVDALPDRKSAVERDAKCWNYGLTGFERQNLGSGADHSIWFDRLAILARERKGDSQGKMFKSNEVEGWKKETNKRYSYPNFLWLICHSALASERVGDLVTARRLQEVAALWIRKGAVVEKSALSACMTNKPCLEALKESLSGEKSGSRRWCHMNAVFTEALSTATPQQALDIGELSDLGLFKQSSYDEDEEMPLGVLALLANNEAAAVALGIEDVEKKYKVPSALTKVANESAKDLEIYIEWTFGKKLSKSARIIALNKGLNISPLIKGKQKLGEQSESGAKKLRLK